MSAIGWGAIGGLSMAASLVIAGYAWITRYDRTRRSTSETTMLVPVDSDEPGLMDFYERRIKPLTVAAHADAVADVDRRMRRAEALCQERRMTVQSVSFTPLDADWLSAHDVEVSR